MPTATEVRPSGIAKNLPLENESETPTTYNWAEQVRSKKVKPTALVSVQRNIPKKSTDSAKIAAKD